MSETGMVAVRVPDLAVVSVAYCPVCDIECSVDADGWSCVNCGSSWNLEGRGGERWVHPMFAPTEEGSK